MYFLTFHIHAQAYARTYLQIYAIFTIGALFFKRKKEAVNKKNKKYI